jgi:hypothetical protein
VRVYWLFALTTALLVLLEGCARAVNPPSAPQPEPIAAIPGRYNACAVAPEQCQSVDSLLTQRTQTESGSEILLTGPLSSAMAVSRRSNNPVLRVQQAVTRGLRSAPSSAPAAPNAAPTRGPGEARELIDLEAHLAVEVSDSRGAARAVNALSVSAGGAVVNEAIEDNSSAVGAALSIRVPSERAHWLIAQIAALGELRSLKTQASDVSRKIADAETVLANLEAALARYQTLFEHAENAHEMTEIEKELERVRLAIERVKTDLEWTRDRVARSTVYVQLSPPREERVSQDAQLYPGLRLPFVLDLEPGGSRSGFVGAGISALITRTFNLDLDLLTRADASERDGVDLLLATAGVELYSNLLGAGRRRFLNPYLGFRFGYANVSSDDALLLGGSLGLELVRARFAVLDLQVRAHALIGTDGGTHVLLEPALALNLAY